LAEGWLNCSNLEVPENFKVSCSATAQNNIFAVKKNDVQERKEQIYPLATLAACVYWIPAFAGMTKYYEYGDTQLNSLGFRSSFCLI